MNTFAVSPLLKPISARRKYPRLVRLIPSSTTQPTPDATTSSSPPSSTPSTLASSLVPTTPAPLTPETKSRVLAEECDQVAPWAPPRLRAPLSPPMKFAVVRGLDGRSYTFRRVGSARYIPVALPVSMD